MKVSTTSVPVAGRTATAGTVTAPAAAVPRTALIPKPATVAPASCAPMYGRTSARGNRPASQKPVVTAGLRNTRPTHDRPRTQHRGSRCQTRARRQRETRRPSTRRRPPPHPPRNGDEHERPNGFRRYTWPTRTPHAVLGDRRAERVEHARTCRLDSNHGRIIAIPSLRQCHPPHRIKCDRCVRSRGAPIVPRAPFTRSSAPRVPLIVSTANHPRMPRVGQTRPD